MSSQFFSDSIFWIEVEKIKPNPYQPRHEFDDIKLKDLAESIRMYGILQPLVVTRKEVTKEDGGLAVEYELISGERRLRASKLAGLAQVPALIRSSQEDARVKLELAIIENLQREDLNPVDRARSFERLSKEFGLKHIQIAEKVGKSREYVSNTMRILALSPEILDALGNGKISEGHTRPLLMLADRPEEQITLFKEIVFKRMTVRESERIARKIASDKTRKKDLDPELIEMEKKLADSLGTRVHIEKKENGGKVTIDFFSNDDLQSLLETLKSGKPNFATLEQANENQINKALAQSQNAAVIEPGSVNAPNAVVAENSAPVDDRSPEEIKSEENNEDLYSISNFSL